MKNQNSSLEIDRRGGSSFKLTLSYITDWLFVLGCTAVGILIGSLVPFKRPFSLENPEISYPYQNNEKIPAHWLGLYALAIPAFIIMTISLVFVPGPTISKSTPKAAIWHRRMWELHVGLLGLCLSLSLTVFITSGMKNLFGKPRPDLLSRCMPDLANLNKYKVGGFYGTDVVTADICQQPDSYILEEGFRSYPSGHSSFASGGLIYLSLYLASKLAISIPFLSRSAHAKYDKIQNSAFPGSVYAFATKQETDRFNNQIANDFFDRRDLLRATRNQAAAPPLYLLIFAGIPICASIYIASTRYSDFRHHGFDILFGYMIGVITSVISFRFYHLPIGQGAGWAWGPRSITRSFWRGIGVGNYAGSANEWEEEVEVPLHLDRGSGDIENQSNTGPSIVNLDRVELLPLKFRLDPIDADLIPTKNK